MNLSTLDDINKFLSYTDGRDKVYKLIQYGAKLLVAAGKNLPPLYTFTAALDVLGKVDKSTGSARKLFRFWKELVEIRSLLKPPSAKNSLGQFLQTGRSIGFVGYLVSDHIVYLQSQSILGGRKDWPKKLAYYAWFGGLVCSLFNGLEKLRVNWNEFQGIEEQMRRQSEADDMAVYYQRRAAVLSARNMIFLSIVKDACDAQVASSNANINPFVQSDLVVAACGIVSALSGGYAVWQSRIAASKR